MKNLSKIIVIWVIVIIVKKCLYFGLKLGYRCFYVFIIFY